MWNPDVQYFMEMWEEASKEEFVKNQIRTLLTGQDFVMFFKKDGAIYGCEEDSRLTFAKIKVPDEDSKGEWSKEANFLGVNLTKGLKGDRVHNLFSKKDIKSIEVIDKDEAEKTLISQAKGKVSKDKIQAKDSKEPPGTIQLKDKDAV